MRSDASSLTPNSSKRAGKDEGRVPTAINRIELRTRIIDERQILRIGQEPGVDGQRRQRRVDLLPVEPAASLVMRPPTTHTSKISLLL
jgi:hypothetical protein